MLNVLGMQWKEYGCQTIIETLNKQWLKYTVIAVIT